MWEASANSKGERVKDAHIAKSVAGKERGTSFPMKTVYLLATESTESQVISWKATVYLIKKPAGSIARNEMY